MSQAQRHLCASVGLKQRATDTEQALFTHPIRWRRVEGEKTQCKVEFISSVCCDCDRARPLPLLEGSQNKQLLT